MMAIWVCNEKYKSPTNTLNYYRRIDDHDDDSSPTNNRIARSGGGGGIGGRMTSNIIVILGTRARRKFNSWADPIFSCLIIIIYTWLLCVAFYYARIHPKAVLAITNSNSSNSSPGSSSASASSIIYDSFDVKSCDNLIDGIKFISTSDTHLSIFAAQSQTKYPFWVQCHVGGPKGQASARNNSPNTMLMAAATAAAMTKRAAFKDDLSTALAQSVNFTGRDEKYDYLVGVAKRCETQLLKRCNSFKIGLLSRESSECPTCGSGDSNCDNVHHCDSNCGQVKSINYPFNYGNNHRCRWTLRAPEGHYVNLSIIDFDIPSANNASKLGTCIFDYLTLIDGYTGKRLGCYCNENLPPAHIISPWNELIIQFDTNSETTGRGFYFEYKFIKLKLDDRLRRQLDPSAGAAAAASPSSPSSSSSPSHPYCLNGWQYFRGSCYKAYTELEPLQWYDAEKRCNAHGKGLDGHLVSILDKDELFVIHYLLINTWNSSRYRDYYIGLIDVSREGVYRWSDNNPMSITDWELKPMLLEEEMAAQPDGGAYEDCTVIRYSSFSRVSNWHDVPCSLGKHYHSNHEKSFVSSYKWDYVDGYICKSDSISVGSPSRSKVRRPLFPTSLRASVISYAPPSKKMAPAATGRPDAAAAAAAAANANANETTTMSSHADEQFNDSGSGSSSTGSVANNNTNNGNSRRKEPKEQQQFALSMLDDNRYFVCDNQEVISVVLRCDGIAHCRDGSDESFGCPDQECLDWQFQCANGRCISIGYYCDFVDNCGDNSDESRCERHRCKLNEFRCQNGQCIAASQRCDLLPDCSDSSDEGKLCTIGSNCNSLSAFQCYNGNCIPLYAVCDGQIDCPGKFHEDENAATCDLVLKSRSAHYRSQLMMLAAPAYHSSPVAYYQLAHNAPDLIGAGGAGAGQLAGSSSSSSGGAGAGGNLFKCTSGNLVDNSMRCLYEFDRYGFQIGCRDVSHLSDCAEFECPERDYVKCPNSYCIPWRYICDGKWDCIMGDDEVGCSRYVCSGQYKCANQSSCILPHQLCDGHRQCPMGDDEWFCDMQCPARCDCIGQSVNCRGANLSQLAQNYISKSVRKLDLSYNRLGPNLSNSDFSAYHDLGELNLKYNGIEVLIPRKFVQLRNLYKLDLSNNHIHSVKRGAFAGLRRVTQLLLESNPELVILETEAFLGLSSLEMLNISSSRILALRKNTFDGLTSLRHLLLRSNMIMEIEDGAFRSLNSLVSLDMRGNDIRYFTKSVFGDLKSLRNLSTDSFKFCCLMNHKIPVDRCLPLPDQISDCEDLLSSVMQRTCIWIAGVVACIGNCIVVVWRYRDRLGQKEREEEQVNSTLLLSLGCSDLLMGIYLIIIASVDSWYRGRYIENADNWRESALCNLCGFLSTVSSEVSVFTLVAIAVNRYTEICQPFNFPYKFTLSYTHRLVSASWCIALAIATLPLLITPYFRGQFYARSGVCLAFHITNQKAAGWLYSIGVFLCVNLVAFIIIVICYTKMYRKIERAARINRAERPNYPIKIALIVTTNFVAWSPTIVLEFIALAGIDLPAAVYSWIAVLVLPVNSAINPLIYTIPNIRDQIRILIRNHRARKSGASLAARNNHAPSAMVPLNRLQSGQQLNNSSAGGGGGGGGPLGTSSPSSGAPPARAATPDLRQRTDLRNVPPGYMPLKQFVIQRQQLKPDQLVTVALEIARDIGQKHREQRVYVALSLDNVFVSDRLAAAAAAATAAGNNQQLTTTTAAATTNSGSIGEETASEFCVFLADYAGYKRKKSQCNHNSLANNQHHRFHHKSDCECTDVIRFGDILFKLIQLFNSSRTKLDQPEQAATCEPPPPPTTAA